MSIETPLVTTDDDLYQIRVESSGLFLPSIQINQKFKNQIIGKVIDPSSGDIVERFEVNIRRHLCIT